AGVRERRHQGRSSKKVVTAPARRALVRELVTRGLSERRALVVVRMSASAYRYQPRPDRNGELRERILALAQRHKRYGVGMIHLKLRQAGLLVNYKRVERLYQEAKLQVRRRKRKKVPVGERQPLVRPTAANQVWSMDFVFDRTAEGRVIKCLTIVDDATHEAVAIEVERAVSFPVKQTFLKYNFRRSVAGDIRRASGSPGCRGVAARCIRSSTSIQLRERPRAGRTGAGPAPPL